jgi:arylsulfatase A-like enzyme
LSSQDLDWDRQPRFLRHRKFDVMWDMKNMPEGETAWRTGWGIDDRVTVRALLDLIDQRRNQRLFALLQLRAGHHPYVALPEHEGTNLPRKEAMLRAMKVADDRVRDVFDGLRTRGMLDSTLVLVVSDHGEGYEGRRAGRNAYQEAAWVPALVVGPQTRAVSGRIDATTSHLDLAPTLLGMLGVPIPCPMKGRDLTRPTTHRLATIGSRPPRFQIGVIDGTKKYIREDGRDDMLFDLARDPREMHNLAGDDPALVARFAERLEAYVIAAEDTIEMYPEHLVSIGCGKE